VVQAGETICDCEIDWIQFSVTAGTTKVDAGVSISPPIGQQVGDGYVLPAPPQQEAGKQSANTYF